MGIRKPQGASGVGGGKYAFLADTYFDTTGSGSSTTYTFSGADLGTAQSDRIICVIGTTSRQFDTDTNGYSCTIAGENANEIWTDRVGITMSWVALPTGSSGDVVISGIYGTYDYYIAVYAIYGCTTLDEGNHDDSGSSFVSSYSKSINNSGVCIAACNTGLGGGDDTYSWNFGDANKTNFLGDEAYVGHTWFDDALSSENLTATLASGTASFFRIGHASFS